MPKLRALLLPALLILLGFALRVVRLGDAAIWWDEGWSFWNAHHNVHDLTVIVAHDSHPPLYQWALHGWMRIAGITEFALRWLSVLAGTLTVATSYALGVRLSRPRLNQAHRAGILAALLVALSAFHVQWSQEIRMYAFPALFATLAVYAALRVRASSGWWLLLIVAGASAPLSHYLAGFVLVILNLHWLLTAREQSRAFHLRWIAAMLVIGVILSIWLAYALPRIRGGGGESGMTLGPLLRLLGTMLTVGKSTHLNRYTPVTLALSVTFLVGLAVWARAARENTLLIVLAVIVPPVAVLLLAQPWTDLFAPPPSARYFVIFTPLIVSGLGTVLAHLLWRARWPGTLAILGVVAVYGWAYVDYISARHYRDDYASLMAAAALLAEPGEPVYYISGDRYPLLEYHLQRATDQHPAIDPVGLVAPQSGIDAFAARTFAGTDRFWLVEIEAGLGDPSGDLRQWINEHFTAVYRTRVDYNALVLYARDRDSPIPAPNTILPPAATHLRPGDSARLGVPGGVTVTLARGDQVIAAQTPEQWQLVAFPIYQAYPPGTYTLRAGDRVYALRVTGTASSPDDPPHNVDQTIGPLRLLGYTFEGLPVAPGESFEVTLYWHVEQVPTAGITVFFHLLGPPRPDGSIVWDVNDGDPARTPLTALWPGLTFTDRRTMQVPDDMPPGWYSLETGLYERVTGTRLLLPDGADRLLIPSVEVRLCTRLLGRCIG